MPGSRASTGTSELIFLGVKEQVERAASGLFKTALGAMEDMFGHGIVYNIILKKVSSICTDGTNEGGLWKFLEVDRKYEKWIENTINENLVCRSSCGLGFQRVVQKCA